MVTSKADLELYSKMSVEVLSTVVWWVKLGFLATVSLALYRHIHVARM